VARNFAQMEPNTNNNNCVFFDKTEISRPKGLPAVYREARRVESDDLVELSKGNGLYFFLASLYSLSSPLSNILLCAYCLSYFSFTFS
jgi:hypothetical protein